MYGGEGADRLYGKEGADKLKGATGNDLLQDDTGNDQLDGGLGSDRLQAAVGNDVLHSGNDQATDYVYCGGGNDTAHIKANDLVDGNISGQSLLDGVNTVTSCETIFVNGIKIVNPLTTT